MRPLLLSFVTLLAVGSLLAETDGEVNARRTALDLAGAFANEGFKLRDGHWAGTVNSEEPALIAVNLYAGNQYWFTAGTDDDSRKVEVDVYDEAGRKVVTENYAAGEKAAAGFSPTDSGQYFISVRLLEGEPRSVCLVCSYK
jgi:hypothetical protein